MRLKRGVPVAGMDPEQARTMARLCHGQSMSVAAFAARLGLSVEEAGVHVASLADSGFLRKVTDRRAEDAPLVEEWGDDEDGDDVTCWTTTLSGGALTMASFLKPISKAKARTLVDGVLERAASYNAEPVNPLLLTEIRVFGSYLADVPEVGDVDLHITTARRYSAAEWTRACAEHAEATGSRARSIIDQLYWPEKHLRQTLKSRSPYIHLTDEVLERITSTWEVLYTYPAPEVD